jgi:hypothetical protein
LFEVPEDDLAFVTAHMYDIVKDIFRDDAAQAGGAFTSGRTAL